MLLRMYTSKDLPAIARLFYDTIQHINIKDYTPDQVRVWSGRYLRLLEQDHFFAGMYTLIAQQEEQIVGYGNISSTGYLDHLYVHKDFQGKKIASALCDALEEHAKALGVPKITVHASITARPFFEHREYTVIKEQLVDVDGLLLKNFVMERSL